MSEWEVFKKRMIPLVKQPFVTIQKRGTFSFNKAAFHALGGPEAVELLYQSTERIIGVRPVDRSEPHAYPVRTLPGTREGSFIISGTAFVNYYGIEAEVSRRFTAYVKDGVLCVDLTQGGIEVTSNRNGGARKAESGNAADGFPQEVPDPV